MGAEMCIARIVIRKKLLTKNALNAKARGKGCIAMLMRNRNIQNVMFAVVAVRFGFDDEKRSTEADRDMAKAEKNRRKKN